MNFIRKGQTEKRKIKYLVGRIEEFDDNVQQLFKMCKDCALQEEEKLDMNNRTKIAESKNALFKPLEISPLLGRQTYKMWCAMLQLHSGSLFKKFRFDVKRTLHFIPLEDYNIKYFNIGGQNLLSFLKTFLRVFFSGLTVKLWPKVDISDLQLIQRIHSKTKKKQFLVTELNQRLHEYCQVGKEDFILGLTWTDLYPSEELNFVLGEAAFQHRCGVFSFGRFEPKTYVARDNDDSEEELEVDSDLLWQMLRVSSHETCHLFGLKHCVFFNCAMNSSSSSAEAFSQPLFLCPICLRKLQKYLRFDVCQRYLDLLDLFEQIQTSLPSQKFEEVISWLKQCLQYLGQEKAFIKEDVS